jgi:hypothetical protein
MTTSICAGRRPRKEYDQLIAAAGEDAADVEAARRALDRRKRASIP